MLLGSDMDVSLVHFNKFLRAIRKDEHARLEHGRNESFWNELKNLEQAPLYESRYDVALRLWERGWRHFIDDDGEIHFLNVYYDSDDVVGLTSESDESLSE